MFSNDAAADSRYSTVSFMPHSLVPCYHHPPPTTQPPPPLQPPLPTPILFRAYHKPFLLILQFRLPHPPQHPHLIISDIPSLPSRSHIPPPTPSLFFSPPLLEQSENPQNPLQNPCIMGTTNPLHVLVSLVAMYLGFWIVDLLGGALVGFVASCAKPESCFSHALHSLFLLSHLAPLPPPPLLPQSLPSPC